MPPIHIGRVNRGLKASHWWYAFIGRGGYGGGMNKQLKCDAVVVGGGMVGLATALALETAGLKIVIVDALPVAVREDEAFDGRASAIAYTSWRMFDVLGVAERLKADAQRIEQILVSDGRAPDGLRPGGPSPFFLSFDHAEINGEGGEPLGYMAENRHLRRAMIAELNERSAITARAPAKVVDVTRDADAARVTLEDGTLIEAALIVAADGRNSFLRRKAGIRAHGWPYNQSAVVATAEIERGHDGVAHEYFLPAGPFAMLPLPGNRFNLVWTEKPRAAKSLMQLGESEFTEEMQRRFGDFVGKVTPVGPRWSFPLGVQTAEHYCDDRLVLVGDSAHAIHPIAGQGFNMGLRDAAALADVLGETKRAGLDIGDMTPLRRYERWRKFDDVTLAVATDGFNRLFGNDIAPVRMARDIGMALTGKIGVARRFFARHAGGETGDKPRLLQSLAP